ncbi:MAG TPA: DUF1559 domain-containing protein [Urbifossiella sp.]|jgi:prepilin-type N-terminal cleavage/methylation domain-containing protein/prepilin-type processing-associated H-X9-DG protein|nr:DUF1559 domain-containing protein [Urbifossiella sp.]
MRRNDPARGGFTLIELLVVIAIIAILIGLLLPAVQKVREAAARTKCANNMKQMALACHSYAGAYNGLPPARNIYNQIPTPHTLGVGASSANNGYGWAVVLLPYIERNDLYGMYKFDPDAPCGSWTHSLNQPVVNTPVAMMQCPSAPPNRTGSFAASSTQGPSDAAGTMSYGDYATAWNVTVITGVGSPNCALDPFGVPRGVGTITDGLSNTILFAEQAGRPDYYVLGVKQPTNAGLLNPNWWGPWASYNSIKYQGYAANGTSAGTACSITCNNSQGVSNFHTGGAMFSMCDGSVRLINTSVPVLTLSQMFSRDGGETASPDS